MPYSCFLIGTGPLLIDCARVLQQTGFLISGLISADERVEQYCAGAGLRFIDSATPLAAVFSDIPFDYLFSIVNDLILPEAMLRLPRRRAINYHDAALPAYAGVHATFWALLNGETTHGISWHLMESGIDSGPLLKQVRFAIEPDDSSIRLNVACYAAAVTAFRELAGELAAGTEVTTPQDLTRRTYVGRNKCPDTIMNWQQPATDTARLARALDFGFQANPFGRLKLQLAHEFLLVDGLTEVDDPMTDVPGETGEIRAVTVDAFTVATSRGCLRIHSLLTLSGYPISLAVVYERWQLTVGQVLPQLSVALRQRYHTMAVRGMRDQPYWLAKFARLSATTLSIAPAATEMQESLGSSVVAVCLPAALTQALATLSSVTDRRTWLLTTFLLTVARLANQRSVGVGYSSPRSRQFSADSDQLMAHCLPFSVAFDWESGIEVALTMTRREQVAVEEHRTVSRDWLTVQPLLHERIQVSDPTHFPIVIHQATGETARPAYPNALTLVLTDDACQLVYDRAAWDGSQAGQVVNRWLLVQQHLLNNPAQPLKSVSLLTQDESHRMLVSWNATTVNYPRHQVIHALVEAQATHRPQAEALRCGTVALTYSQLNQRANQMARYLTRQGVRPEGIVGLCLDRSPELIVCLLAILKAGGAYMPLDPAYPTG